MLFNLINRRSTLDTSRRFFQSRNGISGVGVHIDPTSFPGLFAWMDPSGLSHQAPSTLKWDDELDPTEGCQGAFNLSPPNREISTLNGLNVIICLTSQATQYVVGKQRYYISPAGSFTGGFLLRQDGATAGRACHSFRCSEAGGCFTVGQFTQGASGNKLTYTVRSPNTQQIALNSTTNLNGAGWFIVFITFDNTSKTLTMYEGGNTISGTNVAMDAFSYQANNNYGLIQGSLTPPGGWWIGGVGESFYYSDVKSPGVINALGKYFQTRYNVAWTNV